MFRQEETSLFAQFVELRYSGVARVEKLGVQGNMASAGAQAYNGGLGAGKLMAFLI